MLLRYFLRIKKASLKQLESSLALSRNIPDQALLSCLRRSVQQVQQVQQVQHVHRTDQFIDLFHSFTRRSVCLPMTIDTPIREIPQIEGLLCSWLPHGERVFLYIVEGKGVLIKTENNQNILRGTLPQTFLNVQNKPHHNTICDGILVLEKKTKPSFSSPTSLRCPDYQWNVA